MRLLLQVLPYRCYARACLMERRILVYQLNVHIGKTLRSPFFISSVPLLSLRLSMHFDVLQYQSRHTPLSFSPYFAPRGVSFCVVLFPLPLTLSPSPCLLVPGKCISDKPPRSHSLLSALTRASQGTSPHIQRVLSQASATIKCAKWRESSLSIVSLSRSPTLSPALIRTRVAYWNIRLVASGLALQRGCLCSLRSALSRVLLLG